MLFATSLYVSQCLSCLCSLIVTLTILAFFLRFAQVRGLADQRWYCTVQAATDISVIDLETQPSAVGLLLTDLCLALHLQNIRFQTIWLSVGCWAA